MSNNIEKIEDVSLKQSVEELIKRYPSSSTVIERLIEYFDTKSSERDTKRRKIQNNLATNEEVIRIVDISFQSPVRKKLDIIITSTRFILYNSKNDTIEFEYNLAHISRLGGSCVPSPDKANKTFTYTMFITNPEESIVFNTQDKVDVTVKKPDSEDELLTTDKHELICRLITQHTHIPITQPMKEYYRSTGISSSTGKVEDRAYVIAYLKAKDGFLFFLSTGILYGFKKPTLFFPNASIASTVITNITNRTFDLTLTLKQDAEVLGGFKPTKEGEEDTVQFSMIEQSEYEGIEAYIKKLGINDHSMSEERKAPAKQPQEEVVRDKGKGKQTEPVLIHDDDDEENDNDFEPSDDDSDPLEYDSEADEEEADKDLARDEEHEFQDAVEEDMEEDEEEDLLDEDSD